MIQLHNFPRKINNNTQKKDTNNFQSKEEVKDSPNIDISKESNSNKYINKGTSGIVKK